MLRQSNESEIEIIVSDEGTGIVAHDLKRVWEPFYTTKSTSRG